LWRGILALFEQVDRKWKVVADGALVSNLTGCFINSEVLLSRLWMVLTVFSLYVHWTNFNNLAN
jgi:hypothetical protein